MSKMGVVDTAVQPFDEVLVKIAKYAKDYQIKSSLAYETAAYCLMDSLGCAFLALKYPECTKLLGPSVTGADFKHYGGRVPGTNYELDPIRAAFNIGTMVRWLDYNDTWLAQEWGHPSDNLGAILGLGDYLTRSYAREKKDTLKVKDVLTYSIKAHEIQGVLALSNCFNQVGLDHVLLVRIASTAVATAMAGGSYEEILNAVSNAFMDGGALRAYRHAPNTGSRKSWAAGDASSRGVDLALKSLKGEMGYSSVLSAKFWGFEDVKMKGEKITLSQDLDAYVMENVLFKISYPAEFHAQTAVEASLKLHQKVKDRIDDIEKIEINTQESGYRIINKVGPLHNPADRDHCLQYMVSVPLIFGELNADYYEDKIALKYPIIDSLREKMVVAEDSTYSKDYLDPSKRSIANSVQVFFKDGSATDKVEIMYPVGHRTRRDEGVALLLAKFNNNVAEVFAKKQQQDIKNAFSDFKKLEEMELNDFMKLFVV